jgi:hypothetical protein
LIRGPAALAALVVFPSLLRAQEASVFLGASHARYADSLSGTAGFAAVRLGTDTRLRAARLEGSYSRFANGGWALQAGGQTTVLWSVARSGRIWAGIAAGAGLSDFEAGTASGTAAGGPLMVWRVKSSYLSLGGTGGVVRRIDATWHGLGSASLRWQWVPGGPLGLDLGVSGTVADTQRFADLSSALRFSTPTAQALLVLGVRAGDLSDGLWGSAELDWSLVPALRFEAAAGRYPPDLTGFTDGLFAQAGVRLYALGTGRATAARRSAALVVEPREEGLVRVRVRLRRAVAEAAIAGEWNAWNPVPLRREGREWVADLRLEPGIYRYAIVADGVWTLPDGVGGMDDGFGGRVGMLAVRVR